MILHHLAIEAFGPFAGREEVDFDLLSGSGLFLLCGETGAGKTSVLDAVCFALFGQVPGDRDNAKRLRSDHAAAGHGPRVVLETTVRGRRLRITRSPEWVRPKKRGNGTLREHAKVLVEERIDGEWQQRTSRMDEAGDLVGSLLGMTKSQFCQVAMLPQGRFETFLRSGAQERHTLLEKLFGTHRFRAVEEWLTEHRRRLVRESDGHADRIAGLLERIGEVGGCTRPDELSPDGLLAWSDAIRKETLARLADATEARSAADQSAKDVQVALESARAVADLQARHRDAQRHDADLRALADSTRALETQLRDARRAEVLRPLVQLTDAAVARVGRTREAMLESRHPLPTIHLADDPDDDGREHVGGLVRREREKVAQLEALLPVDTQVTDLDAEVGRLGHQLDEATGAHHRAEILAEETEPRLVRTREAHTDAVTSARRVDPLREQVTRAERILDMTRRLPELEQRRESLRGAHGEAVDAAHQARADWLDLRQARLEGMAAELAHDLSDARPCPVCGSVTHPAPARPVTDAVSAETERAAERRWQHADDARLARTRELADCDQELAALSAASEGADNTIAAARLTALRQELHQAEVAAGQVAALADGLRGLERTTTDARHRCQQLAASVVQLTERCTLLTGRRDQLVRQLAAVVGEDRTLSEALQASRQRIDLLERLLESLRDHQEALRDGERSAQRLAEAVADAGFPDADAARTAVMSRTDISNAETLLRRRADQEARVWSVLDDPQVVDAAATAAVDLTGVTARLEQAQRQRDRAVTTEQTLDRRARRLDTLHDSLGQALIGWRPVRDSLGVAERMAALCAGTSVDNRHRMRLSAFVLAARLGQVVAAANARLLRMTSGRYTLQHSVARGVGDKRGGLGLQVHDGWTGESRDPATLSGGETFLASLALALGLADVVTHESGGTEIRTLFVDEGFGSLDPETLDDVMDVLDQLRSGGRAVGIVSHVVDLRARVPAQMHVHKARDGSSLSHA